MPSVGQQIREERLRLGLKLEDISTQSRIPVKTLQAIESDQLAAISSPFLYRSFVRQFAEHLKLDFAGLTVETAAAALSMPQPRTPGETEIARAKIAPLPLGKGHKSFRWLYSVASLGFVIIACSSLYGVWQSSKSSWLTGLTAFLHSPAITNPRTTNVAKFDAPAVALPRPQPAQTTPSVIPASPTKDQVAASAKSKSDVAITAQQPYEFRVEVSAIERTWVSIIEDGKQTFDGILNPDQTRVLEGHETARIRTGNAGGISCIFNGKSIGPLGERGQVRTVVFTKTNYEVLEQRAPVALLRFPLTAE